MAGQAIDLSGLRVFVSYPRGGLAHTWAERVHAHLDERGAEVWRDEASIRPGDPDWYARICEGLAGAEVVACVLGRDSPQCQWQQKELVEAVERGTPVVALRVDGRATVPLVVKLVQPIEAGRDEALALDQLAQALHDQAHAAHPAASMPHEAAADPARQRELTYLGNLLHRELSDVEDAYVPVSGHQTRAASLARSRKVDVIRTDVRLRRRAVLGEPGAGKSFSLQRIACEYARRAERDPAAPLPLYVALGAWTRANQSLDDFVDEHLGVVFKGLHRDVRRLRDAGRAVLLLDGMKAEPAPEARAAIGRWLGALDLDHRPGTGLRADGVPDIDWVLIDDDRPFIYQEGTHPPLPAYCISCYPVTNRQWQAFIDDGGYETDRWWEGLAERMEPKVPSWAEPTAPRETVSWYEVMAYCRWLSAKLGQSVTLPIEHQWVQAAYGVSGREFAWGNEWNLELANVAARLQRTTLVGLYPNGATPEGLQDMTGNVFEWCLNEHKEPQTIALMGDAQRAVRGGVWYGPSVICRAAISLWT